MESLNTIQFNPFQKKTMYTKPNEHIVNIYINLNVVIILIQKKSYYS